MSIYFSLIREPLTKPLDESGYNEFSMENNIENLEGELQVKATGLWCWYRVYNALDLGITHHADVDEIFEKRSKLFDDIFDFVRAKPKDFTLQGALSLQKAIASCKCKKKECSVFFAFEKQHPDTMHMVLSCQDPVKIMPEDAPYRNFALATFVVKRSSPPLQHLAINKVREFFGEGDAVRSRLPLPDHLKRQL